MFDIEKDEITTPEMLTSAEKILADNDDFLNGGGTDQWKTYGNCNLCRKNKYCSHRCTTATKRADDLFRAKLLTLLAEKVSRAKAAVLGDYLDQTIKPVTLKSVAALCEERSNVNDNRSV